MSDAGATGLMVGGQPIALTPGTVTGQTVVDGPGLLLISAILGNLQDGRASGGIAFNMQANGQASSSGQAFAGPGNGVGNTGLSSASNAPLNQTAPSIDQFSSRLGNLLGQTAGSSSGDRTGGYLSAQLALPQATALASAQTGSTVSVANQTASSLNGAIAQLGEQNGRTLPGSLVPGTLLPGTSQSGEQARAGGQGAVQAQITDAARSNPVLSLPAPVNTNAGGVSSDSATLDVRAGAPANNPQAQSANQGQSGAAQSAMAQSGQAETGISQNSSTLNQNAQISTQANTFSNSFNQSGVPAGQANTAGFAGLAETVGLASTVLPYGAGQGQNGTLPTHLSDRGNDARQHAQTDGDDAIDEAVFEGASIFSLPLPEGLFSIDDHDGLTIGIQDRDARAVLVSNGPDGRIARVILRDFEREGQRGLLLVRELAFDLRMRPLEERLIEMAWPGTLPDQNRLARFHFDRLMPITDGDGHLRAFAEHDMRARRAGLTIAPMLHRNTASGLLSIEGVSMILAQNTGHSAECIWRSFDLQGRPLTAAMQRPAIEEEVATLKERTAIEDEAVIDAGDA